MNISYTQIAIFYLLGVNIITFLVYAIDKLKAKKHWWRIPEATLLVLAAIGGSIGAICGMRVFHHKTLHKKFYIGVPAIIVIQIVAAIFVYIKL